MSPFGREIGEQIGELRGEVRGVGAAVGDLRRVNSEEHAANAQRLERMERNLRLALDEKADVEWVREHERDIDALKEGRAEGRGVFRAVSIAKGAFVVITPFGAVVLAKLLEVVG